MSTDRRRLGYLLAVVSALTGALRYTCAKLGESEGLEYVPLLVIALVVATLCTGTHVILRSRSKWKELRSRRSGPALLYGMLMAWSTLSTFLALRYLNETVVSSIAQTGILLTILLAIVLLKERFSRAEWIGAGLIVVGLLAFRPWSLEGRWKGTALLLTGVLAGSFATIGAKRWVRGIAPEVLMFWRAAIALAVVGGFAWVTRETWEDRTHLSWATVGAAVGVGVLGSYLHGLSFLHALRYIDAAKASLTSRVQPVFVLIVSAVFLGTLPTSVDEWISIGLILVGVIWLAAARQKASSAD